MFKVLVGVARCVNAVREAQILVQQPIIILDGDSLFVARISTPSHYLVL